MKFESLPDEVVVAKALSVLRSIFGDTTVPEVCVLTILVMFVLVNNIETNCPHS